jgi:hypothetical protein
MVCRPLEVRRNGDSARSAARSVFCAVPSASSFEARDQVDHVHVEVSVDLVELDVVEATLAGFVLAFERLCTSRS